MIIEIIGIQHTNKGAVLMLEAIKEQIAERVPHAHLAVPFSAPLEFRLRHGLRATYPRDRGSFDLSWILELAPKKLASIFGIVPNSAVSVVFDASGFGYGDYWGLRKLRRRLTSPLASIKRRKKPGKFILLPQAYGPFRTAGMAKAFKPVLKLADLIFIRDRVSLAYIKEISELSEHSIYAPDFTNLLHPQLPDRLSACRGSAVVIPNEKVIKGKSKAEVSAYYELLRFSISAFIAAGERAILLVHEGSGDKKIALEISRQFNPPVEVIDEPSALVTKAIIANAKLVISSRFHGLVSALSSGVPALACGWSHKYLELLNDYGCPDFTVKPDDPHTWDTQVSALVNASNSDEARANLAQRADHLKQASVVVWDKVAAVITKND